jgi:hypothetical protein
VVRPSKDMSAASDNNGEDDSRCHDNGQYVLIIAPPDALEFIEDAIVLIQITQLPAEMVVYGNSLDGSRLHIDVPDLQRQIVPRQDVSAVMAELDVGYRGNDFGKE